MNVFLLLFVICSTVEAASPAHQPKKNIRILSFQDKQKAQDIRARSIRSIRELMTSTKDPGKIYELLRRYGELYAEQSEYALEKEMLSYDKAYKSWEKLAKGDPPKPDSKFSKQSLEKAVEIYRKLAKDYSTYSGIDITYYELGKNLIRLEKDEGVQFLLKLIKEQPKSAYIPDALFALGEYYFDKHNMIEARRYYNEAAKHRQHEIYPYAIYKLGWTYFNYPSSTAEEEKEKYSKSVTAFKLVIRLASLTKDKESRVYYLREEAINDLIMVWAESEDVEAAWAYFQQLGDKDAFYRMLDRLGDIYIHQGAREKAITVLTRLLKEVPLRDTSPESHVKLLKVYSESLKFEEIVDTAKAIEKSYLDKNSPWSKKQIAKPELLQSAEKSIESSFHFHATNFHKEAQKHKMNEMVKTAAHLYAIYLRSFPNNEKAYELRYLFADLLFDMKKYDESASQFLIVARQNEKNGKYFHDSALNAVVSMNASVEEAKLVAPKDPQRLKKALEVPKEKLKLQSTLDYYVKHFPNKEKSSAMAVTAAEVSFDYGRHEDAMKRFTRIVFNYPKSKQAESSLMLILSFYKNRKDWDETIRYCRLFLSTKGTLIGELRSSTEKLLVFASFERALSLEKKSKPLEAAQAFLDFQKEFHKEPNAPTALYNAMVIYFKEGMVEQALDSAKRVLTTYPQFERKPDVTLTVAETYEGLGDFASASQFFAVFAQQYPKDKRSAEVLYGAGILAKGASQDIKVVEHMRRFLSVYPQHKLELAAMMEIGEAYERLKQKNQAVDIYELIVQKYPQTDDGSLARVRSAILGAQESPTSEELDALAKELRPQKGGRKAKNLLSQHLFRAAEPAFRRFIESTIDTKDLEKGLQAKQNELVKLAKTYQSIISLGDGEYIVASSYKLGQSNEAFAIALQNLKIPTIYDAATQQQIRSTLDQIADGLRKEAYTLYRSTYAATIKENVFSQWGIKAYDRMVLLDPKKSPAVREFIVNPGYTSHTIDFDQSLVNALH